MTKEFQNPKLFPFEGDGVLSRRGGLDGGWIQIQSGVEVLPDGQPHPKALRAGKGLNAKTAKSAKF